MDLTGLNQAIAAVEAAATGVTNADTAQIAAQDKFNAAQAAKTAADSADADATTAFNSTLDALAAAIAALKSPPAPAPAP